MGFRYIVMSSVSSEEEWTESGSRRYGEARTLAWGGRRGPLRSGQQVRWPWAECGRERECSEEETDVERECCTKSKLIIAAIYRMLCAVVGPAESQGYALFGKKLIMIVLYAPWRFIPSPRQHPCWCLFTHWQTCTHGTSPAASRPQSSVLGPAPPTIPQ